MAATLVGANSGGGNVASTSVQFPAGCLANDWGFLFWTFSSAQAQSDPAGFGTSHWSLDTSGTHRSTLYKKKLVGSESSSSLSLVNPTANKQTANLVVIRGLDPTTPISAMTVLDETTSQNSHPCPACTPAANNCVGMTAVLERASVANTGWSRTGTFAEVADSGTTTSGTGMTTVATALDLATDRDSGTPFTPGNWVADVGSTDNIVTVSLALKLAELDSGTYYSAGGVWVPVTKFSL